MSKIDLQLLLEKVQKYISENYSEVLLESSSKEDLENYISHYISKGNYYVEGYKTKQLIEAIYNEMGAQSIITPFLSMNNVEEININSWDDIVIVYNDGRREKLEQTFFSPTHAEDIVRRILRPSGVTLDAGTPVVTGHISNKIRITAIASGIVDKDKGVSAVIRIVNPLKLQKDDFIANGTATAEMLEYIQTLYIYGASTCITGATGSGKTTLMSWILEQVPYSKRLYTIEDGTREFDLVVKDEKGKVLNNVIHTTTRKSDDPSKNITMEKLLDTGLTFSPHYICLAEMKSDEAWSAQEAARTGHAVITTAHANSCEATYRRLATLGARKYGTSYNEVIELMYEAFPIVIFTKQEEDGQRRVMEITECCWQVGESPQFKTLWRYDVYSGRFVKGEPISEDLMKLLEFNGLPSDKKQMFNHPT